MMVLAMSPGDERVCAVVEYMSKSLLCAVVRRTLGSDALVWKRRIARNSKSER